MVNEILAVVGADGTGRRDLDRGEALRHVSPAGYRAPLAVALPLRRDVGAGFDIIFNIDRVRL
jgi:hypothetical protein